mmetsp:Transcript_103963/g.325316  ORF Transcript_103963/g.325316 Transcript_103963/m.325316 type:complete len:240 (+) Transcript_103963:647-1366(+)
MASICMASPKERPSNARSLMRVTSQPTSTPSSAACPPGFTRWTGIGVSLANSRPIGGFLPLKSTVRLDLSGSRNSSTRRASAPAPPVGGPSPPRGEGGGAEVPGRGSAVGGCGDRGDGGDASPPGASVHAAHGFASSASACSGAAGWPPPWAREAAGPLPLSPNRTGSRGGTATKSCGSSSPSPGGSDWMGANSPSRQLVSGPSGAPAGLFDVLERSTVCGRSTRRPGMPSPPSLARRA